MHDPPVIIIGLEPTPASIVSCVAPASRRGVMLQMQTLEKMHSKEKGGFGYELPGQNFYRAWQAW
jgi:hypothetical protein